MASPADVIQIHPKVKIYLRDVKNREPIPERTISLLPPLLEIKVGRGSQTESHLHPHASNAWFSSRVMSREHAVLRADTKLKILYIEDTGSMHGTYVDGTRLESGLSVPIHSNEKVQFGTEIVRGDQVYNPLELGVQIDWHDKPPSLLSRSRFDTSTIPKNSFSVNYSEDEDDSEDDIELVYESIRRPAADSERHSRTFSVPDSDDDESSEVDQQNEESAPSSPAETFETDAQKLNNTSGRDNPLSEPEVQVKTPAHKIPGSSLLTALSVDDDEDDSDKENGAVQKQADTPSSCNEYEPDFSDDDDDECDASDADDGPDEEEEQAFSDLHQHSFTMSENQSCPEARAPSPSDAAMPKSSWYPAANLPAIHGLIDQVPPQPLTFSTSFTEPHGGPAFQPFGYYTGMNWTNNEAGNSFNNHYDHSFGTPLVSRTHALDMQQQPVQCSFGGQTASKVSPWRLHRIPNTIGDDNLARSSKVSINDIIDDVQSDLTPTSGRQKRKADEMSEDVTVQASQSSQSPQMDAISTEPPQGELAGESLVVTRAKGADPAISDDDSTGVPHTKMSEKHSPGKKSVSFSTETIIIDADSSRPRKKVKAHQDHQGSNFFKYFATAVAGVTVGAVGTVFGLAALPADYFI